MKKKVFLSFLMPYPVRSIEAPYLWVYYKQMSSFNDNEIIFIGSKEYRNDPRLFGESRYETKPNSAEYSGYNVPTLEKIESYQFYDFDNTVFTKLEQMYSYNTNQIFKHILTESIEEIETYLNNLLTTILQKYEVIAMLSWCNFPSLNPVALKHNLRIIHNELGAFRKPYYQPTAYFDFAGVNGNTESKNRFDQFSNTIDKDLLLNLDKIKEIMFLGKNINTAEAERFDIGVALQVEDDSNILAFSNGFDSISLLRWISDNHPGKSFSIREHPAGHLKYDKLGHIDASVNSIAFLLKCDSLITINSSVALEAMLFKKQIKILGDNPFSFLMNVDEDQKIMALNFAIFAYMIPYDYLFNFDYYTWRLGNPTERDILEKHLNYYRMRRIQLAQVTFDNIKYHSYIQLFIEDKNGTSEENSIRFPVEQNDAVQRFEFDLNGRDGMKSLRLDPLSDSCVVEIEKLALIKNDGVEIDLVPYILANVCSHHGKAYFFEHFDPQIYFTGMEEGRFLDSVRLVFEARYAHISKDAVHVCANQIANDRDHSVGVLNDECLMLNDELKTKEEIIQRLSEELKEKTDECLILNDEVKTEEEIIQKLGEELINKEKVLQEESEEITNLKNELVSLYTSKSYKMTRPLRSLMRVVRRVVS